MAGCGTCPDSCNCTVVAGDGVTVVGDGSAGTPYEISAAGETWAGTSADASIDITNLGPNDGHTPDLSVNINPAGGLLNGGGGIQILIDPASTAPISEGINGLRVDCCPASAPAISDTPTVDMVDTFGILSANVIPNQLAGLENQAGGVAIKLQGDPAPLGALVCGTRLRFNNLGDLVELQNGAQVQALAAGAAVGLAATQGNFGGTSSSIAFVNADTCPVYVLFEGLGQIVAPSTGAAGTSRVISQQMQLFASAVGAGAVDLGGAGIAANSDYNYQSGGLATPTAIPAALAWRFQAQLHKWIFLPPGGTVTMQARTLCLESQVGWQSTVPNGATFQLSNYTYAVIPQRIGGWLV